MCEIRKVLIGGSVTIVFVHCALFSASQRLVLSGLQWIFGICKNIFSCWERFSMQHFVSEGRSCIISEDSILTLIPQMTWPWWSFSIVFWELYVLGFFSWDVSTFLYFYLQLRGPQQLPLVHSQQPAPFPFSRLLWSSSFAGPVILNNPWIESG